MKTCIAFCLSCSRCLFVLIFILPSILPVPAEALTEVTVQLKWFHQFQFAGYYAAQEKGYYRDEGLRVKLLERNLEKSSIRSVLDGDAMYGVADSGLVIDWMNGNPVVLLKQIFQHSPLILLTMKESGVTNPFQLEGKRVMGDFYAGDGDASLVSMFNDTIGGIGSLRMVEHRFRMDELLNGDVDAVAAYYTSEPYKQFNIIDPRNYGIDFYGDNFFTSEQEAIEHPERVEAMIRATVKGWQYAMEHPVEIVDLIRQKYNPEKDRDILLYEAEATEKMILPREIPVGTVLLSRYDDIVQNYIKAGMLEEEKDLSGFIYNYHKLAGTSGKPFHFSPKEIAWLKNHPKVRIGIMDAWPPLNYVDSDGDPRGIGVEYLKALNDRLNGILKIVPAPFSENFEAVKEKRLDALMDLTPREEREPFFNFTIPYLAIPHVLVGRKGGTYFDSEIDLNGKTVALEKGFYNVQYFRKKFPSVNIRICSSTSQALGAVSRGEADAYAGNRAVVKFLLDKELLTNLEIQGRMEKPPVWLAIGVRKDWPELASILNRVLGALSRDEEKRIRRKWLSAEEKIIALNAEEKAWLAANPVISVHNETDGVPFNYNENGVPKGFSIEYMNLVAEYAGFKVRHITGSWNELLGRLKNNQLDVMLNIARTPEREKFMLFSDPYYEILVSLFVRDDLEKISSIKDLFGKRVAVPRGSYVEGILLNHPEIEIVPTASTEEAVTAVSMGNAEALYNIVTVVDYYIRKLSIKNIRPEGEVGLSDGRPMPLHIGVNRDNKMLAAIVRKAISVIDEVEVERLRRKWVLASYDRPEKGIRLTEKEKAWLVQHPVVRVGNDMDFPPFDFVVGGEPQGYSIDLLNLIARKVGINIEYVNGYTWSALEDLFRQQGIDLLHSLVKNQDRLLYGLFSNDYISLRNYYVTRIEHPEISDMTQLNGKTIAVGIDKGWSKAQFLSHHYPGIKLLYVDNPERMLETVADADADAAICNISTITYLMKKKGITDLKMAGWAKELDWGGNRKFYFMAQRNAPELVSLIDKGLALVTVKERKELEEKWFGTFESDGPGIQLTPDEAAFIQNHPRIVLGGGRSFEPSIIKNADGSFSGHDVDIAQLITERTGLAIDFEVGEWSEIVRKSKAGGLDGLISGVAQKEWEAYFNFTQSYFSMMDSVLVKRGNPVNIYRLSDLSGKRAAIQKGNIHYEKLIKSHSTVEPFFFNSMSDVLIAVATGQADFTILNESWYFIARKEGVESFIESVLPAGKPIDLVFSLSKKWPELSGIFDKALKSLTSEEQEAIREKWYPKGQASRPLVPVRIPLTEKEQSYLEEKETIKMCVLPDWLPYERINEEGYHEGIGHEMIQLIARRIDTRIELVPTREWGQSLENLRARECDILPISMDVPSRRETMNFSRPYIIEPFVIATRADEFFVKNIEAIGDRPVGIIKDYAFVEFLRNRYPVLNVVDVESAHDGLKRVRRGELFGYIDSMPTIGYTMQKYSVLDLKIAGRLDFDLELCIASRSDEPILGEIMQKAVDSITEEERRQIISKWFSIRFDHGINYLFLWRVLAAVAVIFLAGLFWMQRIAALNRKITQANLEAEAANRAKGEFLANMSHEIRTPLNAVTGFSELLSSLVTDEKQKSYLEAIKSSGKNLLLLINDILDLSKIEAGKIAIHYSTVNLRALLREVEQVFALQASVKNIELILTIGDDVPPGLQLDEIRLRQVLLNIVGNAVKFTNRGSVKLSAKGFPKGGKSFYELHISVEDTGIGIEETEIETIFDTFRQQIGQDSGRYGGTGLGLAICSRLVEMMNGRIDVASTVGRGSTFTVILGQVAVKERESAEIEELIHYDDIRFQKGKVLVVDDVESNRNFLKELLEKVNLDVLVAENGHEALVICPDYQPDLVLMDIRMPVMDGVTAMRHLKREEATKAIPIIAVTASASISEQSEFTDTGFEGILFKPVEIGKLIKKLMDHFEEVKDHVGEKTGGAAKRYEMEGPLSPEVVAFLPELVISLEMEFKKKWQQFKSRQPMADVRLFGEELQHLGERGQVDAVARYGRDLVSCVDNFDVDGMKDNLQRYPRLVGWLKDKLEEQK